MVSQTSSPKPGHKWGFAKIRGTYFGGPHNKDYRILVSILRSWKLPRLSLSRALILLASTDFPSGATRIFAQYAQAQHRITP